jgi:hypothetical protein
MRRKHLLMLALVLAAAWMMAVALGGVPRSFLESAGAARSARYAPRYRPGRR